MRTPNRFLPGVLIVLEFIVLFALAVPPAGARTLLPVPAIILHPGDPDETGGELKVAGDDPVGQSAPMADRLAQQPLPTASVAGAREAACTSARKGEWRLGAVLFRILVQSRLGH